MAEVSEKSSKSELLAGFLLFVGFEVVAFYGLQYLTSGLGESNQYQEENTIVSNWLKTMCSLWRTCCWCLRPCWCSATECRGATGAR